MSEQAIAGVVLYSMLLCILCGVPERVFKFVLAALRVLA